MAMLASGCSSSSNVLGSSSGSSSSSSFFDKLGFGSSPKTSGATDGAANPDKEQQDFDCPSIEVRQGASTLTIASAKGGDASAADLRYQGSIVRTARECPLRNGIVNLKVGIEGRIILGPTGSPGQIEVPMRLAIVHEGPDPKTILTRLYRIPVTIPPNEGNITFTHVADDVAFPMPKPAGLIDEYVVYVGFDQYALNEPKKPAPKSRKK
jgi:hypothetical protein